MKRPPMTARILLFQLKCFNLSTSSPDVQFVVLLYEVG
jgi:hypothetical protein